MCQLQLLIIVMLIEKQFLIGCLSLHPSRFWKISLTYHDGHSSIKHLGVILNLLGLLEICSQSQIRKSTGDLWKDFLIGNGISMIISKQLSMHHTGNNFVVF